MPLLDVKDLTISFSTYLGEVKAVREVSFHVEEGETVGIVGESGCGKSVTAQSLMRLNPTPPANIESGSILFEEEEILKKSNREMRKIRGKKIGMIFQDPMTALNPTMRIGKQLCEMGISYSEALALLEMVEIRNPPKRMLQYPHELSGGMRQRVMIAIAIACNPKLLIADEPTTALDVTIQAQILDLLKSIQKKKGMSIILITHDLGVVASMCDRVLVMYGGQIVESADVKTLFSAPAHPYTEGLLRSMPRLDMEKQKELTPIEGTPPNLLSPPPGCPFCARCNKAMRICQIEQPKLKVIKKGQSAACWENAHE
ncbi:MAG: ABC transporter ATP-binding protein [Chlamydiales bacterium]|nr:ABC transporter ATP-binding protein [Chlamydiales bacterium]